MRNVHVVIDRLKLNITAAESLICSLKDGHLENGTDRKCDRNGYLAENVDKIPASERARKWTSATKDSKNWYREKMVTMDKGGPVHDQRIRLLYTLKALFF